MRVKQKHSATWWALNIAWWSWIVLGVFFLKSCEGKRDYRTHPVTDEEAEAAELLRSR